MAINIKNEQVIELAKHASRITGGTQTAAIEQALRQFIAQHERQSSAARADVVWNSLDVIDSRLGQTQKDAMQTVMDEMYDESGLPA